jgi:hypothetical protein
VKLYTPNVGVGSWGVHPVAWGQDTYFKPWFFDGRSVYWGQPQISCDDAARLAAAMARGEQAS